MEKLKTLKRFLWKLKKINEKFGFSDMRALTDLTGDSYRLILEAEWKSLADWENSMKEGLGNAEWQKWYQNFVPLVDSASREIMNIVA